MLEKETSEALALKKMNIIKGNKHNNDYYRLNAILCEEDNIETIKETNPFA